MAGEATPGSIGAALAAGVDGLETEEFEQFKNDASLGWCQRMKAAERDALAELTAADTMEMQLASLRRQETPGHRATHGGLLGSVRRGNLFGSPTATPTTTATTTTTTTMPSPDPASREAIAADSSSTVEALRQQLAAAEQARALAEQRHNQQSREAQESREQAEAELRTERNRAIEALAVAEESRTVADSAAQRLAESERLLSAMRTEAAATRVAAEHEHAGMISAAEAADLRLQLAAHEECRWAAEKELSVERAARRAAEAAIRTEQRKTATVRVAAEQAAQAAHRQADATRQAWGLKQAELELSCDKLKSELLQAQQARSHPDGDQKAISEELQKIKALMEQNADLQAKLDRVEEASTAQEANLQRLEAGLAGALTSAQNSEQQLQQCCIELAAAENRARSAELTASAARTELATVREQFQAATNAGNTAAIKLEQLRARQAELEGQHTSTVDQLRHEKTARLAAEKALDDEREQLGASVLALDKDARQCADLQQELAQTRAEVCSLSEGAVSLSKQVETATAAHASAESALHEAQVLIGCLQQQVEAASASRTESQELLDAARATGDSAELQASIAQAELVMVRAQLQAAQSSQQTEQCEAQQKVLRASAMQEDAERRADSEKANALNLAARVSALETELATTQQLCDANVMGLSEALRVAQAEVSAARDVELNGAAQASTQIQELQLAKTTETQLRKELAAANDARVEAERALEAATARATETKTVSTSELHAMKQELQRAESARTNAAQELEALKAEIATASSSGFPGEVAVQGAPTRAELNATIELAQKLLENQTEVCRVEKQANASLHEALGDVTAQLEEAEALAARWEAATHASTQLLQCAAHIPASSIWLPASCLRDTCIAPTIVDQPVFG